MTVRVEVDLNVRVRGNGTFVGFEDVDPGDAVMVGQRVIARESESGLVGDAVVTEVDPEKRLIFLAVDWHSFRDADSTANCENRKGAAR